MRWLALILVATSLLGCGYDEPPPEFKRIMYACYQQYSPNQRLVEDCTLRRWRQYEASHMR